MGTTSDELTAADLERLARAEAPDLAEAVLAFLAQPDKHPEHLPQGALPFSGLLSLLGQAQGRRSAEARRSRAREAWQRYLSQQDVPPPSRFALADLLVSLYERDTTREVAVELIRRHYARLGGPERLAWLMESADREVGLFAVRLPWEKHRPTHLPEGWRPAGASEAVARGGTGRFPHVDALRDFLLWRESHHGESINKRARSPINKPARQQ
jgi:hypothetical protein